MDGGRVEGSIWISGFGARMHNSVPFIGMGML